MVFIGIIIIYQRILARSQLISFYGIKKYIKNQYEAAEHVSNKDLIKGERGQQFK